LNPDRADRRIYHQLTSRNRISVVPLWNFISGMGFFREFWFCGADDDLASNFLVQLVLIASKARRSAWLLA
jgi:hypothetical protein